MYSATSRAFTGLIRLPDQVFIANCTRRPPTAPITVNAKRSPLNAASIEAAMKSVFGIGLPERRALDLAQLDELRGDEVGDRVDEVRAVLAREADRVDLEFIPEVFLLKMLFQIQEGALKHT
jgi:hypothetical protein